MMIVFTLTFTEEKRTLPTHLVTQSYKLSDPPPTTTTKQHSTYCSFFKAKRISKWWGTGKKEFDILCTERTAYEMVSMGFFVGFFLGFFGMFFLGWMIFQNYKYRKDVLEKIWLVN